jgi:hypothetical protein
MKFTLTEPQNSLVCSQEPAAGPCPYPVESSAQSHTPVLLGYGLILSSHLHLCLPSHLSFQLSQSVLFVGL